MSPTKRNALSFPFMNNESPRPSVIWFSGNGCVEKVGDVSTVYVGGTLIGNFGPAKQFERNLVMLRLAQNESIKKEALAQAFGLSSEQLRRKQREKEKVGIENVSSRGRGGSTKRLTSKQRMRVRVLFAEGVKVAEAHRRLGKRFGVSYRTFLREHEAWVEKQRPTVANEVGVEEIEAAAQQSLEFVTPVEQHVDHEQHAAEAEGGEAGLPRGVRRGRSTTKTARQRSRCVAVNSCSTQDAGCCWRRYKRWGCTMR